MTRINYSALTVLLSILLLAASVPITKVNGYYYQDPSSSYHPYPQNQGCQSFGNICPAEGDYKCCDGLACDPNTVGGASVCLPPLVPGPDGQYPWCRAMTKLCIEYGAYDCCGDLSCVLTYPVNPIGVGVCLPMGGKKSSTNYQCQKEHQLCEYYGQYGCCPELSCVDPRTLPYPPLLPIDPTMLPPGVGVCAPLRH